MKKSFTAAAGAFLLTFGVQADPGTFHGYNADQMSANTIGLYTLNPQNSSAKLDWKDPMTSTNPGVRMLAGWLRDGKLCGVMSYYPPSDMLYRYVERDLATGTVTAETDLDISTGSDRNLTTFITSAAYNPIDGMLYAFGLNEKQNGYAYKVAPANNLNEMAIIYETGTDKELRIIAMAVNPYTGELYGVTRSGNLVKIHPLTGEQTLIGSLGIPEIENFQQFAMAWNADSRDLLLSWADDTINYGLQSIMYKVDPVTGKASRLGALDDYSFTVLVNPDGTPSYAPAAPGMPTDVKWADNKINFTLPTVTASGTPLTDPVSVTVYLDGQKMTSVAHENPGSSWTLPLSVPSGRHSVAVVPYYKSNYGISYTFMLQTGGAIPAMPTGVTLTKSTLSWDAVTLSDTGEEVSGVEYEVTLNGSLLTKTTETTLDVSSSIPSVSALASYRATVTAVIGANKSNTAQSNKIVVGTPLSLPKVFSPEEQVMDLCVYTDVDGNNSNWSLYDGYFLSGFGTEEATEDWLFLPAVNPADAFALNIAFDAKGVDEYKKGGSLKVMATTDTDPQGAVAVSEVFPVKGTSPISVRETWVVPAEFKSAGRINFAVVVESEAGQLCPVEVGAVTVMESNLRAATPSAPTEISATGAPNGELAATVNFTAPTTANNGTALNGTLSVAVISEAEAKTVSCQPGEKCSVTLKTVQGVNNIMLSPFSDAGEGMTAYVSIFTGEDKPGYVKNLRGSASADNNTLYLKWDAPDKGWNGGTLADASDCSYVIYQNVKDDDGEFGFEPVVETEAGVTEYTIPGPGTATLQNIELAVAAANSIGVCPSLTTYIGQLGEPYAMPVKDDFEGDNMAYEPLTVYNDRTYTGTKFAWTRPSKFGEQYASSAFTWALTWQAVEAQSTCRIDFPKVSTEKLTGARLCATLWDGAQCAVVDFLAQAFPSFERVLIGTSSPGEGNAYQEYNFDLPADMNGQPWVQCSLEGKFAKEGELMILADYRIDALGSTGEFETLFGSITGTDGMIRVAGYEGHAITVTTLDGKLVAEVKARNGVTCIEAAPGVYAVKVADRSAKVIVR